MNKPNNLEKSVSPIIQHNVNGNNIIFNDSKVINKLLDIIADQTRLIEELNKRVNKLSYDITEYKIKAIEERTRKGTKNQAKGRTI